MCVCVCARVCVCVCIASGVLTVEMGVGVLTVKEKLKQVDMLRLEVGSKGLRADVPHERERDVESFGRADIVES